MTDREFAREYDMPSRSSKLARLALFVLVLLVAGAGSWFLWQKNQDLEQRLASMDREMKRLENVAARAEKRAETAESSAAEAAQRADQAAVRADEAEQKSDEAEARAEAERQEKLKAWKAEEASRQAQRQAVESQKKAKEEAYQARLDAKLAQLQARDAEKEVARLKEEREQALDKLQKTLSKFAETRRSKLGLVMDLGDSIEFDFDKAELRPHNRELLSRIAGVLMTLDDFNIQVYGHTDDVGSEAYNQMLSEQRAQSVRDYLVESGVDDDVISVRGFGKDEPLVHDTTPEARQRNRRVEIAVVHVSGEVAGLSGGSTGY